jgi:excisionase family DNA binding protein
MKENTETFGGIDLMRLSAGRPPRGTIIAELMRDSSFGHLDERCPEQRSSRISVPEIALRLAVGRQAVYAMLEQGVIPGIRLGRRWIITRHAYRRWERTCGLQAGAGLQTQTEVTVLN